MEVSVPNPALFKGSASTFGWPAWGLGGIRPQLVAPHINNLITLIQHCIITWNYVYDSCTQRSYSILIFNLLFILTTTTCNIKSPLSCCLSKDSKCLFQGSREREVGALAGEAKEGFIGTSKSNLAGWVEFCQEELKGGAFVAEALQRARKQK